MKSSFFFKKNKREKKKLDKIISHVAKKKKHRVALLRLLVLFLRSLSLRVNARRGTSSSRIRQRKQREKKHRE